MLHFLLGLALCIFIGERLVHYISAWRLHRAVRRSLQCADSGNAMLTFIRITIGLLLGGTAVVAWGIIFFPVDAHRPCETRASTYQEFIAAGYAQNDAEFLSRTGAGLGCR